MAGEDGGELVVRVERQDVRDILVRRPRRRQDWYDVAYVLIHTDLCGPAAAAEQVRRRFPTRPVGQTRTTLDDLASNFADAAAQGSVTYAETMLSVQPARDWDLMTTDAVAAVAELVGNLVRGA